MSDLKVAVIYYSATGSNFEMAQVAKMAAEQEGAVVRLARVKELAPESAIAQNPAWKAHYEGSRGVPEVSLADLEWADAMVFSFPTRFGNVPSQLQQFLDTTGGLWFQGKLADKVVTAMTTASNSHGGQEATLLSFYKSMYHWGAIVVAPGYTDPSVFKAGGNPYGTSATVSHQNPGLGQEVVDSVAHQVKRMVEVVTSIKRGRESSAMIDKIGFAVK